MQNSKLIKTYDRTKQGGPISPKRYSIYADDMLIELRDCEFLLETQAQNLGVLVYADDSALISVDIQKLEQTLTKIPLI